MATAPQLTANRRNAAASTGPRTPAGKARAAANSSSHGLFAATNHIAPEEESEYQAFHNTFHQQFEPAGAIELTLAAETISAAWRLRRCRLVEADILHSEDPAATQLAVDRARSHAHRLFTKGLAELRRLQTERQLRHELLPQSEDAALVSFRDIIRDLSLHTRFQLAKRRLEGVDTLEKVIDQTIMQPLPTPQPAENTASPDPDWLRSVKTPSTPRNALCPCNSGQKFKRCCGRSAPAVSGARAE